MGFTRPCIAGTTIGFGLSAPAKTGLVLRADVAETGLVRLGLLGPAEGDVLGLGRAAEFLLTTAKVNRAVYLGLDASLDRAVAAWARKLVGDDPSDDAAWRRAADVAIAGTPPEIDRFVAVERARMRLKTLETLPTSGRTIEMVGDRVAVLIHDKAALDEEDILAANLLVFGKSSEPLVKKIGTRWFVSPGHIGAPGGGLAVLDDEGAEVVCTMYDAQGRVTSTDALSTTRPTKVRVQGGA
jgi:hypothetical protein